MTVLKPVFLAVLRKLAFVATMVTFFIACSDDSDTIIVGSGSGKTKEFAQGVPIRSKLKFQVLVDIKGVHGDVTAFRLVCHSYGTYDGKTELLGTGSSPAIDLVDHAYNGEVTVSVLSRNSPGAHFDINSKEMTQDEIDLCRERINSDPPAGKQLEDKLLYTSCAGGLQIWEWQCEPLFIDVNGNEDTPDSGSNISAWLRVQGDGVTPVEIRGIVESEDDSQGN